MHSRDNYHINLINGHPGDRERHERAKEVLITGEDFLPGQSCGGHLSTFFYRSTDHENKQDQSTVYDWD